MIADTPHVLCLVGTVLVYRVTSGGSARGPDWCSSHVAVSKDAADIEEHGVDRVRFVRLYHHKLGSRSIYGALAFWWSTCSGHV